MAQMTLPIINDYWYRHCMYQPHLELKERILHKNMNSWTNMHKGNAICDSFSSWLSQQYNTKVYCDGNAKDSHSS